MEKTKTGKIELLAPAGNMECLKAAVSAGADAVYFGGKAFGARSFADNFGPQEIYEAAVYCRLRKVKTYVTVNTMTLDREFSDLESFAGILADAGIDGIIVQDLGVVRYFQQLCPEMSIHASTQMTVHNLAGVRLLESMGVQRIVLSRELSREDMQHILSHCNAEIEVFVHGAMCMSYSGQCLMSSVLGGRSGNRGSCAQPCRLPYHSGDGREQFYLSLKDMSLIRHLAQLEKMGVASLKIEGRMKGPDYVSVVTRIYRKCIDEKRQPSREEYEMLNRVFYRGGLTDGYFTGKTGKSMFAFHKPDNPYVKGNMVLPALPEKTVPVLLSAILREGSLPELTLEGLGESVTCRGEKPLEKAEKEPAGLDETKKQLSKMGGTAFFAEKIEIQRFGKPFVPVRVLNGLRREAVAALEKKIMEQARKKMYPLSEDLEREVSMEFRFTASVQTAEQFCAVKEFPFYRIDVPLHVVSEQPELFLEEKERMILSPPVILHDSQRMALAEQLKQLCKMGFSALRAENLGWIQEGKGLFSLWGGHRLNTANSRAMQALKNLGLQAVCLSPELNLAQIRDLKKYLPAEVLVYGYLPLMLTENCISKNLGQCPCPPEGGKLWDRRGKVFSLLRDGDSCRSVVLNTVPLYMGDQISKIKDAGAAYGRLLFTMESPEECRKICSSCLKGEAPAGEYTRLHFYKGVMS
ncbi:U32 family peptidase [Ructibacterium gallinarum]|uniref:U32 family peptidase n=1 Tax=Ructibacterium gallinarum TaxID=2779355 RepID=A0A9D5LZF5_9FIRM|nr:U32 family peptidase [Ructibacterium gallinarum]MBE5039772.1 U32 family peptidase [Ructibacterium gallinarum]